MSVIEVGQMTTAFSHTGFPWGNHRPWRRLFCRILLVFLPCELLQDGLQLPVYHYKPMLRHVHLNYRWKSNHCCKFSYYLCSAHCQISFCLLVAAMTFFTRRCCLWDQMTVLMTHVLVLCFPCLRRLFLHTQLRKGIEVNIPVLEIKSILAPQCN